MSDQPTHPELVASLKKDPADIAAELSLEKIDMLHMCAGIGGEAGEVIDVVKKHIVFNKALDRDALIKEMGDLEFYLEGLRQTIGISREEVLETNITKLTERYDGITYSDEAANARFKKVPEPKSGWQINTGECPCENIVPVDVIFEDGVVTTKVPADKLIWNRGEHMGGLKIDHWRVSCET